MKSNKYSIDSMDGVAQEDIIRDLIMTWPLYIQYGRWNYYRHGINLDSTIVNNGMMIFPGWGFIQLPYYRTG